MDLGYLRRLIKLVDESGISELELEEEGTKIRITKAKYNSAPDTQRAELLASQIASSHVPPLPVAQADAPALTPSAPPQVELPVAEVAPQYHEIRSPIVGTFYRAPAPDAEPYVQVGQIVQPGQVLCIVEAMKLMNEIESDVAGRIAKILVENAQPVEYNQLLFLIEKI
ncbi:MAG: acetyl-CoA carboxylase biotin carboxyl carrier protein [Bacteroidota bacterium]